MIKTLYDLPIVQYQPVCKICGAGNNPNNPLVKAYSNNGLFTYRSGYVCKDTDGCDARAEMIMEESIR